MADSLASLLDHSVLKPNATRAEVEAGARLAATAATASICVQPHAVSWCVDIVADAPLAIASVIDFPHGCSPTPVRVAAISQAIADGATEIDIPVNRSLIRSDDWSAVSADCDAITTAAHSGGAKLKLIFETCELTDAEIVRLCELATAVDWVKTSTGFGSHGATPEAVRLMRQSSPCQVKASGGIRTRTDAETYRDLGCTRLGTSGTAAILGLTGDAATGY